MFAMGAVLVSHPFEVARVLIVCQEKNRMIGSTLQTLQSVYANEGVAGLYRGLIPRSIAVAPLLFTLAALQPTVSEEAMMGLRTNPILGSLKLA